MSLSPTIRRIVLTGFMGAGKSTTGALLARELGWQFLDSDHVIEARAGRTVAQIFASEGEAAFRTLEAETIRNLSRDENLVLALGGGAIEHQLTREALQSLPDTRIVFLDAPLDIMVARCLAQPDAAVRPVLADRQRLVERFMLRLPHYRSAHLTVATEQQSPAEVASEILTALREAEAINKGSE